MTTPTNTWRRAHGPRGYHSDGEYRDSDAAGGQEAGHHGSVSPVAVTVDHDVCRHATLRGAVGPCQLLVGRRWASSVGVYGEASDATALHIVWQQGDSLYRDVVYAEPRFKYLWHYDQPRTGTYCGLSPLSRPGTAWENLTVDRRPGCRLTVGLRSIPCPCQ